MTTLRKRYGPWALVTGASSGIGREIALALGAQGFGVVLSGRNHDRLQELADLIGESVVVAADITTDSGMKALLAETAVRDIGLVVLNAGEGTFGLFGEIPLDDELRMLRLNCEIPLRLAHTFKHQLSQRSRSGVVFLSSIVAWQGVGGQAHYSATKGYIQNLAEGLAVEWKPYGIDVLSSAPGPVATRFADRAGMEIRKSDDARLVAHDTLSGLGRKTTVIPGRLGKVLSYSLASAPRSLRVRIMSQVAKGMKPR